MTSIITRRSILRGLFAAPAIVAASSLMPIRGIVQPLYDTGTWVAHHNEQGILDVRYYTRVLSKKEIGQMFRAGVATFVRGPGPMPVVIPLGRSSGHIECHCAPDPTAELPQFEIGPLTGI